MMIEIAGYLITWTTYGTWLPGDSRGWRSRVDGLHEVGCLDLEVDCACRMTHPPSRLDQHERLIVHEAIKEHCAIRGWNAYAINARSNHVHVVVAAFEKPQKVRDQLKANCTRRLRISQNTVVREKLWTKGGDCRILRTDEDLEAAVRYVIDGQ